MSSLVAILLCNQYAALQISAYDAEVVAAVCPKLSWVDQRDVVYVVYPVYYQPLIEGMGPCLHAGEASGFKTVCDD